jgi:uncharacterized protein (UPF0548 family)
VFLLRQPSEATIKSFLSLQQDESPRFPGEHMLDFPPPHGFKTDHNRVLLGTGSTVFERSVTAIERWEMFNIGWLTLCWPDTPIRAGEVVAVLARHLGFWSLNACRIVSTIDVDGPVQAFGFRYATLDAHAESGQEQFKIEWRHDDDSIWYDILAYSRPNAILSMLGYPIARSLQKRFARDSMAAMCRAATRETGRIGDRETGRSGS